MVLFVHIIPAAAGMFVVIRQAFVFSFDIRPCPVSPAILPQPFPLRDRLQICDHQDSASALGTADDRSLTICRDKIMIYAGSLVTKCKFIF
jgi:hypothetical protein